MVPRTLAAVAALALLAGCSGDPEPKLADPTPSASSSAAIPSPSASSAAETPEEFIDRWLRLEVDMQNTGDSTAYRAALSDCVPCLKFADQIDGYYAAGGYVRIAGEKVTKIEKVPSSNRSVFEVTVDPEPTIYRTSASDDEMRLRGDVLVFKITLEPAGEGWRMINATQLAQ